MRRHRILRSLRAAEEVRRSIRPADCVDYLGAWQRDRVRWRDCLATFSRRDTLDRVLEAIAVPPGAIYRSPARGAIGPARTAATLGRIATEQTVQARPRALPYQRINGVATNSAGHPPGEDRINRFPPPKPAVGQVDRGAANTPEAESAPP
jgi:hypothetical protein